MICSTITSAREISQSPDTCAVEVGQQAVAKMKMVCRKRGGRPWREERELTGPVPHSIRRTRHRSAHLDVPSGEAELVPALQHRRAKIEVVPRLLSKRDLEVAVLGSRGVGIVPFFEKERR